MSSQKSFQAKQTLRMRSDSQHSQKMSRLLVRSFRTVSRPFTTGNTANTSPSAPTSNPTSSGAGGKSNSWVASIALAVGLSAGGLAAYLQHKSRQPPDYKSVYAHISENIMDDPDHDDGTLGPILLRLCWHACGTFDKNVLFLDSSLL